jgi:hypothetical protein
VEADTGMRDPRGDGRLIECERYGEQRTSSHKSVEDGIQAGVGDCDGGGSEHRFLGQKIGDERCLD